MESNQVTTGTTTLAMICKEGIVLAADKKATAGYLVVDKHAEKIHLIQKDMALTTAGTVSDIQLLIKLIKAEIALKSMRSDKEVTVKEAANLLGRMIYSNIRKFSTIPGLSHFILGGKDKHGFHIYDLFPDGSVTECQDYVSSGSGSVMAYGVLETLYKKDLPVQEGIKLAVKSINAAVQRDIASGEGIDIVTITKDGTKKVLTKEIDTRIQA